jgi:hypothetical protein
MIFLPGRTIIRIRSPRLEASSQQDNVGKGSRHNRSVTLGIGLALRAGFGGTFSSGRRKWLKLGSDSFTGVAAYAWLWKLISSGEDHLLTCEQSTQNWYDAPNRASAKPDGVAGAG